MLWDIIIVGAGPAGLTAALYAARYRRSVLVLHDGRSRASWILPATHNVPGFPDGVAGPELLARMTEHATEYGATLEVATVSSASVTNGVFALSEEGARGWLGRALILATGLDTRDVRLPEIAKQAAVAAGTLRYCPVCDGYEHRDARIAVVGSDTQGAAEALFLRTYSDDVSLFPLRHAELTGDERAQLDEAGVEVVAIPIAGVEPVEGGIELLLEDDSRRRFDVLYPALGCYPHNMLAKQLGLELDEIGKVVAMAPFATSVPGLYCAGDLVDGLDQISVAMGHGAIAATKAHNWLRDKDGEKLES